ncbi:MAG: glycosyltransferase family 4 protein [Cytophagales bacterium]|nr:glycosyltransferase family 4 protein [Cytophagales bacterium]
MILFVLEKFPSKSEHFIANEIAGLYDLGVDLAIIAMRKETSNKSLTQLPVTYVNFWVLLLYMVKLSFSRNRIIEKGNSKGLKPFLSQLKVEAISKIAQKKFQDQNIAHIHAHFAFLPTEVAQYLSKSMGIPFSFTAHAQDLYTNDSQKLQLYLTRAKFVFTCTQFGRAFLKKIAPHSEHIHCIYHGISLEKWPFQKIKKQNQEVIKLLYVGRLVEKKGISLLLESIKKLTQSGKSIQCTVVGSGPLEQELKAQSRKLAISEHLHFAGYTPHHELLNYYQSHDLLVCPSVKAHNKDMDGIPNVILEAMAVGLPVIASDISGIPEIIAHRETGMLFSSGDVNGIVQHVATLSSDQMLYMKLRNAARLQLEEKFDLRQSNHQIKTILHSTMAS